jgi:hypothetical protein
MWEPEFEPEPMPARALPPDGAEEMENADTQLIPPPHSAQASPAEVSQNSLIMAVVCQYGHASAQNATSCRICGSPINPQGPQLLPRPVLAVLRGSDGTMVEVDRAVLVGRAPSAQRSTARSPKLMTVPSPGHDISRTHLEVAPKAGRSWSPTCTRRTVRSWSGPAGSIGIRFPLARRFRWSWAAWWSSGTGYLC